MEKKAPQLDNVFDMFMAMPTGQLVLFGVCTVTWLIGGNILVAYHYKRVGKHWASGLKPFAFPFKDFNGKEWSILAVLALASLAFGLIAVTYGKVNT